MAPPSLPRATFVVSVLTGCSTASAPFLDSGVTADAPRHDDGPPPVDMFVPPVDDLPPADTARADTAQAYSHAIVIDGVDDFTAAEQFATTSNAFTARVTWDAATLYIGYSGPDLDPATSDAKSKWMFAYIDVDPGGATGSLESLTYNTQKAKFPAGFGAELYLRWKCDATFHTLEQYAGGTTWTTTGTTLPAGHAGPYVEIAIPRSALGATPPQAIGIATFMINEKPGVEGTFAGMFTGNFVNGYGAPMTLTKYLHVDFTSPQPPNDPGNVVGP
jgi:hypothetical protein